jgi:hypothetical protein
MVLDDQLLALYVNAARAAASDGSLRSIGMQRSSDEEQRVDVTHSEGGEPACWAHLLCPECGVVLDGGGHAKDCKLRGPAPSSGGRSEA